MKNRLLSEIKDLRHIERHKRRAFDYRLDFLTCQHSQRFQTYLELSHDGGNLVLEALICDLPSSKIDLVAHEDDGDVDPFSAKERQPEFGDAIETCGV